MAGILGSYSDSTCNTHNALQNISGYACGVTFSFRDSDNPPDMHYGVVTLQECCDMVNRPVMRIPGNTGCEIQFCDLAPVTSTTTYTIEYGYATGSGTAAQTPSPTVTQDVQVGPPSKVENCMKFVYEGDLPENVSKEITDAGSWCIVRMYDTDLSPSEVSAAVTASPAPASWSSAAVNPWDAALSSAASATANPTSTSGGSGRYPDQRTSSSVRICALVAILSIGLVAAL
ncbi:hypothetical protein M426DRAFT_325463 [Hypoxylon sp. CI-4A]|nr:hypothetical protein M426DRAFT_325463 [Hypoxylon sp. CI-4A]